MTTSQLKDYFEAKKQLDPELSNEELLTPEEDPDHNDSGYDEIAQEIYA